MSDVNQHTLIRKEDIAEALASESQVGARLLEPLRTLSSQRGVPLNILEDREVSNDAEVHKQAADLWYCLEGEVRFVCGGELVSPLVRKNPDGTPNPSEMKAGEIRGGVEVSMRPGDWLWVPAGVPHQHSSSSVARLVIIKIPVK